MGLWFWRPLWRVCFNSFPHGSFIFIFQFCLFALAVLGLVAVSRLPLVGVSGGPL